MHILGPFIFLTICGIISFILNIFLFIVFLKGFPVLSKLPYYYYCFQILLCNITSLLVKFVYLPIIMLFQNETIPETYMVILALAETISYHGELFFILALSVYRVLIFVFGRQMDTYAIIIHVIFVWFNTSGFIFFQCHFQCFDTTISPNVVQNDAWDEIEFYSACTFKSVTEYFLILATTIVNDYFPIISLLLYGCIVFKIRYDFRHFIKTFKLKLMVENKTHRSDLYILLQAIAIYACFFFNFRILIIMGYGYKKIQLNWIYTIVYFLMYVRNTIQPIFLLFFNKSVRKISKEILSKRKVQKHELTLPIIPPINESDYKPIKKEDISISNPNSYNEPEFSTAITYSTALSKEMSQSATMPKEVSYLTTVPPAISNIMPTGILHPPTIGHTRMPPSSQGQSPVVSAGVTAPWISIKCFLWIQNLKNFFLLIP